MSNMKILECVCENQYCDVRYSPRKRPMNPLKSEKAYRCCICGRQHSHGETEEKPKK